MYYVLIKWFDIKIRPRARGYMEIVNCADDLVILFSMEKGSRRKDKRIETFDFLGFTHYCSTSKKGKFRVKLKTSRKKFKQKVQEYKVW